MQRDGDRVRQRTAIEQGRRVPVAFFMGCLGGPGGGGAERVVIIIANEFARRGIDVDLVLRRAEGPYIDLVSSAVKVVDLRVYLDETSRLGIHLTNLRALIALCRYLGNTRPHAIVSTVFPDNLHVILARILAGSDCRVVITQHNSLGWVLSSVCGRTQKARLRWVARRIYPLADAAIAVSQGVAENLRGIVPGIRSKLRVIYNPVDVEGIQCLSREEPDHPWFRSGSRPVILGAGRLHGQKDFPTLVKAFALVRKEWPAKLVILGEGNERQKLEALVSELGLTGEVSLPGFVSNPFSYMKRSAVFALSSLYEGFSLVVAEALACGCPVVSTDCPSGPNEILEGGKWGELVPVGDVEALAVAIDRTLRNPPAPDLLRNRAAFFSVDRAVGSYLDALGLPEDNGRRG